jgi:hypothetical protein
MPIAGGFFTLLNRRQVIVCRCGLSESLLSHGLLFSNLPGRSGIDSDALVPFRRIYLFRSQREVIMNTMRCPCNRPMK